MGPLNELVGMIPGMGRTLRGVSLDEAQTEEQLKRVEAIILSMTPEERQRPRILNASRKRRIARGSGTEVQEINILISQYRQMKKMIKRLNKGKGGMRGLSLPRFF
jgi:signal recognition particle subunit SRP54